MQITIVNNSSQPVAAPGAVTVPPTGTVTLAARTVAEYIGLIERYVSDLVTVTATLETADLPPIQCTLKAPADPVIDATDVLACGFDMEDLVGTAFSTTGKMYFGVFDDAACTIPSVDATLDTAATGTIDAGAGTNVLEVTPAAGVLSVTCSIPAAADQTVYFKAWAHTDNPRVMDTSGIDSVDFTKTP
jgi:hypothetical protein